MKRFLTLTLLTLAVGAGIFVAWMSAGGGAAVELSEDEMAAARESCLLYTSPSPRDA